MRSGTQIRWHRESKRSNLLANNSYLFYLVVSNNPFTHSRGRNHREGNTHGLGICWTSWQANKPTTFIDIGYSSQFRLAKSQYPNLHWLPTHTKTYKQLKAYKKTKEQTEINTLNHHAIFAQSIPQILRKQWSHAHRDGLLPDRLDCRQ